MKCNCSNNKLQMCKIGVRKPLTDNDLRRHERYIFKVHNDAFNIHSLLRFSANFAMYLQKIVLLTIPPVRSVHKLRCVRSNV
jgi:hypothetical protein